MRLRIPSKKGNGGSKTNKPKSADRRKRRKQSRLAAAKDIDIVIAARKAKRLNKFLSSST